MKSHAVFRGVPLGALTAAVLLAVPSPSSASEAGSAVQNGNVRQAVHDSAAVLDSGGTVNQAEDRRAVSHASAFLPVESSEQ